MDMLANVSNGGKSPFDTIRHLDENGIEFWMGRELMPVLGYQNWQRFGGSEEGRQSVIEKASLACQNSVGNVSSHFTQVGKMVNRGQGGGRQGDDWKLSRYACYLVAMNGDPRKPEIAMAQSYFAVKTHQAELAETKPALPKSSQFIEPEVINAELEAIKFFTENGDLQLAQLAKVHLGNRYLASQQKLLKPANIPQYEGAVDIAIRLGFKVPKNYEGSLGSHVKTRHGYLTVGKDNRYSLASGKQIPANMYPFGDPDIEKTVLDYCLSKSFYHRDIDHVA